MEPEISPVIQKWIQILKWSNKTDNDLPVPEENWQACAIALEKVEDTSLFNHYKKTKENESSKFWMTNMIRETRNKFIPCQNQPPTT